jgi:hypothetical protein
MTIKKIYAMMATLLIINCSLMAADKENNNIIDLKLQFKIPTVYEKENVYILPKDKLSYTAEGDILILSRKYACIYRFNSKGQYIGTFLRKGEGPGELSYPQSVTPLPSNRFIILNDDKFIFYEIKENGISETERRTVPYSNVSDIDAWNREKLFVLTAYPLAPGLKGSEAGKFLHIFDIKNEKSSLDYFGGPEETSRRQSAELRSEYGSGDIYYFDDKLFLVYNQPGDMYIFNPDGTLLKKISTKFHFVKYNTANVERVEQDGDIYIRMFYATTCQMNILSNDKTLYLVTRIDQGKKDNPDYRFYLSPLDYKAGNFVDHFEIATKGVDLSKAEFKTFNEQNLVFLDEDFIYCFSPQ